MKKTYLKPYLRAGLTALIVVFISTVFFFLMAHIQNVTEKVELIKHILRPISIGLIIAFLLLPIHNRIYRFLCESVGKKEKSQRARSWLKALSIALSLFFAFLVLYVLLALMVPQVYLSIVGLIQSIPEYINKVEDWVMGFLEDNPELQKMFLSSVNPAALTLEEWLNNKIIPNLESLSDTLEWVKTTLLPNITGVFSNVSSLLYHAARWLMDAFIGIIVSVYLLASKDTFAAQTKKIVYSILPTRWGDLLVEETRNAYRIMSGFINGKLVDSLIIGMITFVCCTIFDFPYTALIAMIIGVTNIIPFFGPFIGAIPSALLILLVDPMKFLYFCIFVFVLQQFDGNILGPKILGETTGLASFWVLFSILLFGGIFGFAGMVLGVPVFAIFYSIMKRLVNKGLQKKNLSIETDEYMGITGRLSDPDPEEPTEIKGKIQKEPEDKK